MLERHRASYTAPTAWWRMVLCIVLVVLASIMVAAAVATRYVNDNILDTERYLEIIGPLPQNPAVAHALGQFTAERLFDSGAVETQIADFLPPRLAPAAPLFSDALKEQVTGITERVVASEAFLSIWLTANREAHEALMAIARSDPVEPTREAQTRLNLEGLFNLVRERFGGEDGAILTDERQQQAADVVIDLRQSVQRFRNGVRAIETGAWLLPLLALLLLAGAIFAANNRRRAVLGIGITLFALGLSFLLAFKIAVQQVLGSFEQAVYRDAAQVVYEALYGNLRARFVLLTVVGGLIIVVAILCGPYRWAVHLRELLHIQAPARYYHRHK